MSLLQPHQSGRSDNQHHLHMLAHARDSHIRRWRINSIIARLLHVAVCSFFEDAQLSSASGKLSTYIARVEVRGEGGGW